MGSRTTDASPWLPSGVTASGNLTSLNLFCHLENGKITYLWYYRTNRENIWSAWHSRVHLLGDHTQHCHCPLSISTPTPPHIPVKEHPSAGGPEWSNPVMANLSEISVKTNSLLRLVCHRFATTGLSQSVPAHFSYHHDYLRNRYMSWDGAVRDNLRNTVQQLWGKMVTLSCAATMKEVNLWTKSNKHAEPRESQRKKAKALTKVCLQPMLPSTLVMWIT